MLANLHVKNLALIEEADIYFQPGLNILTGETGAGKSIVLGSINIAIGNKVSSDIIRKGADYALTELLFHVEDTEVLNTLKSFDIEELDEGDILISRKVTPTRSVIKINGQNCTAGQAKQIAAYLINIHGQHDNQMLLDEGKHLALVDEYGSNEIVPVKAELLEAYKEYAAIQKDLQEQDMDAETRSREISFLEYEIHEIEQAELQDGEDEQLESQFRKMSNMQKIIENLVLAKNYISGEDTENMSGLSGMALRSVRTGLQYDDSLQDLEKVLTDVENMVNDASYMLSEYLDKSEFSEEEFLQMQTRLDLINNLKMKYGNSIDKILTYCEEKKQQVEKLYDHDAVIVKLKEQLAVKEEQVRLLCGKLSALRHKYAQKLTASIVRALTDLNFLEVQFVAEFEQTEQLHANGYDKMRFMISTNPGEDIKPLSKIASGGELSRIMLAIKTVTANQDNIGTLIFDEIDAGISGKTAQLVANKLAELSKVHQILCITHLPQIAAQADFHFKIEKTAVNQTTTTDIYPLKDEESVRELARLLGGSEITDAAIQNARELKNNHN